MKTKLMAAGAVLAALVSSATAQRIPCSGILADPRVQALATQAMREKFRKSLTKPEEVYKSFQRRLDDVTQENMKNGPGDTQSRLDLFVAVHAALANVPSGASKPWIPPKSRITPPGPPITEGYRPPDAWRHMDPSLHRLLIKTCFPKLENIKSHVAERLEAKRIAAEKERRAAAQREHEEEQRNIAENERRREEHARKMEAQEREEARQREELARRQEEARIEAAKPINQLRVLYTKYKYLKLCHEARLGYLVVWIRRRRDGARQECGDRY